MAKFHLFFKNFILSLQPIRVTAIADYDFYKQIKYNYF